jgi:hypothetical protein
MLADCPAKLLNLFMKAKARRERKSHGKLPVGCESGAIEEAEALIKNLLVKLACNKFEIKADSPSRSSRPVHNSDLSLIKVPRRRDRRRVVSSELR